jgi:hypothetical protein
MAANDSTDLLCASFPLPSDRNSVSFRSERITIANPGSLLAHILCLGNQFPLFLNAMKLSRTTYLAALLALPLFSFAQAGSPASQADTTRLDPALAGSNASAEAQIVWHDVTTWGVEGRAWGDQARARWFDRFPSSAEKTVTTNVWNLSRDSAGMMVRFETNAETIHVDYQLLKDRLALPTMPATGASGVDLYARDPHGQWRWVQVSRPTSKTVKTVLVKDLAPGTREYALYLPLYNGIESLQIGVPPDASFKGLAPRAEKPIVFYGTSITHGAAASRPGMVHTAILGRRFDRPVINLGFSGNGRMDTAVGDLLVQIDAAVYVIDCLPNMNPASVTEKTIPLVKQIRATRPDTPIVLVEDRRFTNDWITPAKRQFHTDNHAALRAAFNELQSAGVKNLFYIEGDNLLGDDSEGATDASHPNDLGFMRQADAMQPVIARALEVSSRP